MATAPVIQQHNGFVLFIDACGRFFQKAEPVAVELAAEAEPVLALTPYGPEYDIAVNAILGAQKVAEASLAANVNVSGVDKMALSVAAATPALTTILSSKGVTEGTTTHIANFLQAVFGLLSGPAANKLIAQAQGKSAA